MSSDASSRIHNLYVHVPFCASKCEYCAFYSEASNGAVVNRYVDSLLLELERIRTTNRIRTLFFGGGTPSLLNLSQWSRIANKLGEFEFEPDFEWTVECNPATVSADKAQLLKAAGVNRVSMGVQSLHPDLLDRLGRVHSREMVFRSYEVLRSAGFENVNLDLMFAIPGQTLAMWDDTLDQAIALQPDHLSSYEVIYEDDTPLFQQLQAGEFEVDEDLAAEMYAHLLEIAASHGYIQYEIANFARDGSPVSHAGLPSRACRHNVNYWRGGDFYGAGPSASSRIGDRTFKNISNTEIYCQRIQAGKAAHELHEQVAPFRRAGETAAFGLRMPLGWEFTEFRQITGFDLRQDWEVEMKGLVQKGWAEWDEERFRLNRLGLQFADAAAECFLK